MATAEVRSPAVRTGALPLMGSTIARVNMIFGGIWGRYSSSDESEESMKEEGRLYSRGMESGCAVTDD